MSIAAPIGYSIVTRRPYRAEALTALFPRIFLDSDIEALAEVLQHRRCFRFAGHKHLRLSEYLLLVCRERSGRPGSGPGLFWDRAYDLALDKFSSLPQDLHTESGTDALKNEMLPPGRTDCRKYYAAVSRCIEKKKRHCGALEPLEEERLAARVFQQVVNWHITLAHRDARRSLLNPFVSRYRWQVDGKGAVTVRMPKYLKGKERPTWLEKHVDNPDPGRPGERERVQAIINERLVMPRFTALEPEKENGSPGGNPPNPAESARRRPDLARFLAREKAVCADKQRPAIRALKPKRIERLVLEILDNLHPAGRTHADIARSFGISRSCLSRFAGLDWFKQGEGGRTAIPDLWLNLAMLCSQSDMFREVARDAGVLDTVAAIAARDKALKGKGGKHEQ